ncbi:MAG: DUF427 domain-containing protein [Rhizomicrobium sp.]
MGDRTIADTHSALRLSEASSAPVFYIPRTDAQMLLLVRSDHRTYCPYKGECSHFSIRAAAASGRNAAWSYEQPYPAVAAIKDCLAFDPDRVLIQAERSH